VVFGLSAGEVSSGPWNRVSASLEDFAEFFIVVIEEIAAEKTGTGNSAVQGHRLSYLRPRERPYSAETMGLISAFVQSEEFHNWRYTALKLLNRKDLTGTFRLVDRETFLLAAISDSFEILTQARPDLLVFAVTPHEFLSFVLWKVAVSLGVQVLFFQPSSIAPTMLARTGLDTVVRAPLAATREFRLADRVMEIVDFQLGRLLSGDQPGYMQIQRERDDAVRGLAQAFRSAAHSVRWLFSDRFPESFDLTGHGHKHGILSRGLKVFLTRSLQRSLKEKTNRIGGLAGGVEKYCVFGLHYEPERTSLPEGLPFDYQGHAVLAARAMIPADVSLIVKEHYSQQTSALRGFVGRSPHFYDFLESLPNTFLAPTSERLADLVDRAECVLTLTGSIGIEAVLRGVPVGYFGTPWWAGLPGTVRVQLDTVFGEVTGQNRPKPAEVLRFLRELTADVMIPGLAGVPIGTVQQRLGRLPDGLLDTEVVAVAESIKFLLPSL
jgi:hypothetical protein